jgi:hypothetical protein
MTAAVAPRRRTGAHCRAGAVPHRLAGTAARTGDVMTAVMLRRRAGVRCRDYADAVHRRLAGRCGPAARAGGVMTAVATSRRRTDVRCRAGADAAPHWLAGPGVGLPLGPGAS